MASQSSLLTDALIAKFPKPTFHLTMGKPGKDTFHPFPKLPKEIRDMIWKLAMPSQPRTIRCHTTRFTRHNTSGKIAKGRSLYFFRVDATVPVFLHVCQETRALAKKVYSMFYSKGISHYIYFAFARDTMCFTDWLQFEVLFNDNRFNESVRKLMFSYFDIGGINMGGDSIIFDRVIQLPKLWELIIRGESSEDVWRVITEGWKENNEAVRLLLGEPKLTIIRRDFRRFRHFQSVEDLTRADLPSPTNMSAERHSLRLAKKVAKNASQSLEELERGGLTAIQKMYRVALAKSRSR